MLIGGRVFIDNARMSGRDPPPVVHRRPDDGPRKPGIRWVLLLGGCAFAAGFFGPLIFTPEANQGPLVGILISGPIGLVTGAVLLVLCTVFGLSARLQWRILTVTAIAGSLIVIVYVQPGPVLRGYVIDLTVESCVQPGARETQIIDSWRQRITQASWATPTPGWEARMRQTLLDAPGVIIEVHVNKQISVREKRKPWNRGQLFATAGRSSPEETSFYVAGTCADFPPGRSLHLFEKYGFEQATDSREWPPSELLRVMAVSSLVPVPAGFANLKL